MLFRSYGSVFHGDGSGKIDQAQQELMLANQTLGKLKVDFNSDDLFWMDPWSAEGQAIGVKMAPLAKELRLHAEQAIVLLEQARAADPQLREPAALEAMALGARRLDLIGMKWELSQEIIENYALAVSRQHDKSQSSATHNLLDEISSMNGRCQDLRDAYSAAKAEYSQVWMGENRPYWLDNVTVRYDVEMERWQRRADAIESAEREWSNGRDLPAATTLGLAGAQ